MLEHQDPSAASVYLQVLPWFLTRLSLVGRQLFITGLRVLKSVCSRVTVLLRLWFGGNQPPAAGYSSCDYLFCDEQSWFWPRATEQSSALIQLLV